MNLQGYMVGNGATNWNFDVEPSFPATVRWFNIVPPSMLAEFEANDCHYYFYPGFSDVVESALCDELWDKMNLLAADLNWYDLYRPVYPNNILSKQVSLKANRYESVTIDGVVKTYKKGYTLQEYTPFAKHLKASGSDPVILGDYITSYLNREDVRTVFNIPTTVQAWEECSETLVYTEQKEASQWIYTVLKDKVRKLFYSGDTDGAVSTYGSKLWIKDLNWDVTTGYRAWKTNEQVSGYVEKYDGLDFVTIKGVGHMAPQWARASTTTMITAWVFNENF